MSGAYNNNSPDKPSQFPVDFDFGLYQQQRQVPLQNTQRNTRDYPLDASAVDGSLVGFSHGYVRDQYMAPDFLISEFLAETGANNFNESNTNTSTISTTRKNNSNPTSLNNTSGQIEQQLLLQQPSYDIFSLTTFDDPSANYYPHSPSSSTNTNNNANGYYGDYQLNPQQLLQDQLQQSCLQQNQDTQEMPILIKQEPISNPTSPFTMNSPDFIQQRQQQQQVPQQHIPPVQKLQLLRAQYVPPPDTNIYQSRSSSTTLATTVSGGSMPFQKRFTHPQDTSQGSGTNDIMTPSKNGGRSRVKSSHNVIEQRYRNKINDKFTALQNSVPTLRITAKRKARSASSGCVKRDLDGSDYEDADGFGDTMGTVSNNSNLGESFSLPNDEDLEGLEPARKLNKGTILLKSIEYIKFLERKNDRMRLEHEELVLKARMLGLNIDEFINPCE
ncbi:uncharacterized protein KQ657_000153 [Scheffersomyces spartinae]|uniref:BHLH domain-containing protein n=1 Tax=Scheffersomyces spartinae TaxID=45513 RepID=A0A9P8AKP3_9ASCO|nr:uncharacterized protein KQ657_000153 [Scheffersomyces spartinae]KAG7196141.1 hypothetical protein KQ657_000153 [Scheffersomyces spartinae]